MNYIVRLNRENWIRLSKDISSTELIKQEKGYLNRWQSQYIDLFQEKIINIAQQFVIIADRAGLVFESHSILKYYIIMYSKGICHRLLP